MTVVEAKAFMKAFGWDERTPLFSDLSLTHKATVDGGTNKNLGPRSYSKKEMKLNKHGVRKGTIFGSLDELKHWIKDYSVKNHRPFRVKYSDEKVRYQLYVIDTSQTYL